MRASVSFYLVNKWNILTYVLQFIIYQHMERVSLLSELLPIWHLTPPSPYPLLGVIRKPPSHLFITQLLSACFSFSRGAVLYPLAAYNSNFFRGTCGILHITFYVSNAGFVSVSITWELNFDTSHADSRSYVLDKAYIKCVNPIFLERKYS